MISQLGASASVVWLMDLLKKSDWFPWMSAETRKLNIAFSVAASALTAAGIHIAFAHIAKGEGSYQFVIDLTGLTATNVVHFFKGWIGAYSSQQIMYIGHGAAKSLKAIAEWADKQ